MAAWAPKGAWANQAEGDGGAPPAPAPEAFPALADLGAKLDTAFPSLGDTKNTKTSKKKQKQTMSLSEFQTNAAPSAFSERSGGGGGGGAYRPPGGSRGGGVDLNNIELPTGPRQREDGEDEAAGRPGGAFRDYGGDRGGREGAGGAWSPPSGCTFWRRRLARLLTQRAALQGFALRMPMGYAVVPSTATARGTVTTGHRGKTWARRAPTPGTGANGPDSFPATTGIASLATATTATTATATGLLGRSSAPAGRTRRAFAWLPTDCSVRCIRVYAGIAPLLLELHGGGIPVEQDLCAASSFALERAPASCARPRRIACFPPAAPALLGITADASCLFLSRRLPTGRAPRSLSPASRRGGTIAWAATAGMIAWAATAWEATSGRPAPMRCAKL